MINADVAIIGAGIAGASIAAELAPHVSVVVLESEDQPGYHTTGRSAAFWSETYGGRFIQPLTSRSGQWLQSPTEAVGEASFLAPRGELMIGRQEDEAAINAHLADYALSEVALERLDGEALDRFLPARQAAWDRAVWLESCRDIDVARLHAAYLSSARRSGALLLCRARVEQAANRSGSWKIATGADTIACKTLVNAAGAWADPVAKMAGVKPIGITPFRRTITRVRVDAEVPADLPLVIDINGGFYFKPDAGGRLWLSPHDETVSPPCDAAPEEIDVAIAIDRLESAMRWKVEAVEHSWAGLRSFAPDRLPVYGSDPANPAFFWFAGQGGFGIQTAPAAAKLAAGLILGGTPDPLVSGIDAVPFSPARFSA